MISQEQAIVAHLGLINLALSVLLDKRHDYSGDVDPFGNFRAIALSHVTPAQGAVIRMGDKYKRIAAATERPLRGEDAIRNDFPDIMNYAAIVALLLYEDDKEVIDMLVAEGEKLEETIRGLNERRKSTV